MPPDSPTLPQDVEGRVAALGQADLLLAVASRQQARTVGAVVGDLQKGARGRFPQARVVLAHADAGSTDGTVEAVTSAAADLPVVTVSALAAEGPGPSYGLPGGIGAVRTFCRIGRALGVRALCLVGADLRSVPEDWMERLVRPVWDGDVDFVAPVLSRHVLDGTLTTCLLYPLTRALYGRALRQAMTVEAAWSASFMERLCEAPAGVAAARVGPLYLTTTAAAGPARLAEAWLASREEVREGRLDLGELLTDVVGSAFALAELYEDQWREPAAGPPVRRLGEPPPAPREPTVNAARMVGVFRQGLRDLVEIWEQALRPDTLADLFPLGDLGAEEFAFSSDLWARVVYDYMLAYRLRAVHRPHLLQSLVPLYLGRLAGLVREAAGQPPAAQERLVERQARAFEVWKSDLADRWR